jgi:hypothetical protein
MTPREKAKVLYNKMAVDWVEGTRSYPSLSPDFVIPKNQYVKECALIAVDEILSIGCVEVPYWYEVKQEIEKL